jgi:hypothetical protein
MSDGWQTALSIIGGVGGVCGVVAIYYAWRQTKLMSDDIRSRKQETEDEIEWAARFERVMRQVLRINPYLQVKVAASETPINVYSTIFPNAEVRRVIQSYIVELDSSQTQFLPRRPRPDELRSASMRKVVEQAENSLQAFRERYPDAVHHLGPAI